MALALTALQRKENFRKFIGQSHLLVFDDQGPQRKQLLEILSTLGAPAPLTHVCQSIPEALALTQSVKVELILAN